MKKFLFLSTAKKHRPLQLMATFDIAKKSGAEIIAMNVVEEVTTESYRVTGEWHKADWEDRIFTFELLKKSKAQLEKLVKDPKYAEVKVTGEQRVGNPYHGITTIVTEKKVDLVVMGTRGHTKLEEMVIGTNTEKVMRHARCPLAAYRSKKPTTTDFKGISCTPLRCVAGGGSVFEILSKKRKQMYDSTIHLGENQLTPSNFQRDVTVKNAMEKFAKKLGLKNYTLNIFNDISEEMGVIYFGESIDADLIAMAAHDRTGLHVMAGSIAKILVTIQSDRSFTFVVKR